jgi:tRNA pseudouridine38-40 synthase
MRNVRMLIEYDGAGFAGWQVQPGPRTVQGALESALATLTGESVRVRGAGRTDAGVHARGQVAAFYTSSPISAERVARGATALAGPGVAVVAAEDAPNDWDPRKDARGKVYAYSLLARQAPSPLGAGRAWHVPQPLDAALLEAELRSVLGEHDFSAFRATDCASPDPVKRLVAVDVVPAGGGVLIVRLRGSGFLKQMVRILVGSAIDVARGHRGPGFLRDALTAKRRDAAGPTAPPEGLCLERVFYDPEPNWVAGVLEWEGARRS